METMPDDMKAQAKEGAISYASPADRANYLNYGISLLTDVSESIKKKWCILTRKSPGMYTTKETSAILRKVLCLRINGYSVKQLARHLKSAEITVSQVEGLAIKAIKEAIEKKKASGLPILGG